MKKTPQSSDLEHDVLVQRLLTVLPQPPDDVPYALAAHTRRYKARTICAECGAGKMHAPMLYRLAERLDAERIYTNPPLTDPGLKAGDTIKFARRPFSEPPLRARYEHLLQDLIREGVGKYGELKDLRLIKEEYRLVNGRRIDLLCEEARRNGRGRLVAIELKRGTSEGTVQQMVAYLGALQQERIAEGRPGVRGMIVTGDADAVGTDIAKALKAFDIRWLRYRITLERIP